MSQRNTRPLYATADFETITRVADALDQWATRRRDRASAAAQGAAQWLRGRAWEGSRADDAIDWLINDLKARVDTRLWQAMARAQERDFAGIARAASDAEACALVADVVARGPAALTPAGRPTRSSSLPPIGAAPADDSTRRGATHGSAGAAAPAWLTGQTAPLPPMPPVPRNYAPRWEATGPENQTTIPEFLDT